VLVVAGGAVWFSTRSEATASSAPVQHLLAELPEEYSEEGVCRPWSDTDRPPLAAPLAAVECDPGAGVAGFGDPGTGRERRACPDAAYAPQPEYDGEGFRERYSCSPTVDGRLRLMRVWERGVIGVVYPEPADLDAHYAWFEGPQAPA
jgi:hypothetical protein